MEKLCKLSDINNFGSKGFTRGAIGFFLVRRERTVFAYRNSCPHLQIPLEWTADQFLDYDGELIQCATHGALFTIDGGRCIYGPCLGRNLRPIKVELRNEEIWLDPASFAGG